MGRAAGMLRALRARVDGDALRFAAGHSGNASPSVWSVWSGWSGLAWLLVTFFSLSRGGIRRGLGLEGLCYSCTGGQKDWPVSAFPLLLSLVD